MQRFGIFFYGMTNFAAIPLYRRQALDRFTVDELNNTHPSELASFAMRREWTSGAEEKARQIIELEERMEYPNVSMECQVISADTRTVIIDGAFAEALRKGDKVSRNELMKHSVQIWAKKIDKLLCSQYFMSSVQLIRTFIYGIMAMILNSSDTWKAY